MRIEKLNHADPGVRQRLMDYLAPHEPHALFILGNLVADFPESHLYVAVESDRWLGVAGYYAVPKSLVPFSRDAEAVRRLIRHVVALHPEVRYIIGIDYAAEPACDEVFSMGYEPANQPRTIFMECEAPPPRQPHQELCRPMREEDLPQVARLIRHVRKEIPLGDPVVRESELALARMAALRHVLEVDGRIVSIASTNGKGVSAFQILGVVTDSNERGRGYAGTVCASLYHDMARQGVARCVLFTPDDNLTAQRCYQRLGFRQTGMFCVAKLRPRE